MRKLTAILFSILILACCADQSFANAVQKYRSCDQSRRA